MDDLDGRRGLRELFDGRSQLLVYHFMFGPDWEEGCPSCSFWADSFDGVGVHLAQPPASDEYHEKLQPMRPLYSASFG